MASLPFVVQPKLQPIIERIGDDESGIIEIERKGFLSIAEKTFLQQGAGNDQVASHLLNIIRKVSVELKISADRAHDVIMDILANRPSKDKYYGRISEEYAESLAEVTQLAMQAEGKKEYLKAICMIIHRINSDFNVADVSDIHPTLISALAQLCDDEENKSIERLVASKASSEFAKDEKPLATLEKK